jgi:hypothetical protein
MEEDGRVMVEGPKARRRVEELNGVAIEEGQVVVPKGRRSRQERREKCVQC